MPSDVLAPASPPKLLDQLRQALRVRHRSPRTEEAYVYWARDLIVHHGRRHPKALTGHELAAYFHHLTSVRKLSAATHAQALSAIVFLYKHVLHDAGFHIDGLVRPRRTQHVPVVLTHAEVSRLLGSLSGECQLIASLLYGSGLRLLECCTLRVQDLDLARFELVVRRGKGAKDRRTMIPRGLVPAIERQLQRAHQQHERDFVAGVRVAVPMPWPASTRQRRAPGTGAGSSPPPEHTVQAGLRIGTISMSPSFSARSPTPSVGRASRSEPPATRCATASPPTCSSAARTFVQSRSCSATATSRRPRSTPMFSTEDRPRC